MKEIDKTKLTDQTKFRLEKITEIQNYFHQEINQRKLCSKKLHKCYCFWLYRQNFNCLNCNKWWNLYYFFCDCCWSTNWNSRSKFYFNFFFNNWSNKKLLSITRNKKKKRNKILMLAKSKLNRIETLITQALIDMEISHKNLLQFLRRKINTKRWERMWEMKMKNKKLWDWVE